MTLNIAEHALPKVDLVLCRDCLVHLSTKDAVAALHNLKRSGSTYLLATTFPEHADNPDVITGYWRPINLELPPFALPRPMLMINEGCPERGGADKSLGLWRIADLSA